MSGRQKRTIVSALLLGAGIAIFYFSYDMYRGKEAVSQMCEFDGGLTINERVDAAEFVDDTNTAGDAIGPLGTLLKYDFQYVAFSKSSTGPHLFHELYESGYYRASLLDVGDPRCIFQSGQKVGYLADAMRYGLATNRCLAVERTPARPLGYVYSAKSHRIKALNGYAIGVNEYVVGD